MGEWSFTLQLCYFSLLVASPQHASLNIPPKLASPFVSRFQQVYPISLRLIPRCVLKKFNAKRCYSPFSANHFLLLLFFPACRELLSYRIQSKATCNSTPISIATLVQIVGHLISSRVPVKGSRIPPPISLSILLQVVGSLVNLQRPVPKTLQIHPDLNCYILTSDWESHHLLSLNNAFRITTPISVATPL